MEFLIILTTISLQFELFFLNVTQDISILLSSKILRISEMMERKKRDDDNNYWFVGIQCEIFRCITLSNPANDRHETTEFNEYHRIYLDVKYICNDEEAFEKN